MESFKSHILVIDDDEGIRSLLKQFLNENGYLVNTASNASEAQEKILSQSTISVNLQQEQQKQSLSHWGSESEDASDRDNASQEDNTCFESTNFKPVQGETQPDDSLVKPNARLAKAKRAIAEWNPEAETYYEYSKKCNEHRKEHGIS